MDIFKKNALFTFLDNIFNYLGLGKNGFINKNILSNKFIITIIVLFQGCFGSAGIIQTPKLLKGVLKDFLNISPLIRFIFILTISYTATNHIGISIFTTFIFAILLNIFRTKEEQNKMPQCGPWKCMF